MQTLEDRSYSTNVVETKNLVGSSFLMIKVPDSFPLGLIGEVKHKYNIL